MQVIIENSASIYWSSRASIGGLQWGDNTAQGAIHQAGKKKKPVITKDQVNTTGGTWIIIRSPGLVLESDVKNQMRPGRCDQGSHCIIKY